MTWRIQKFWDDFAKTMFTELPPAIKNKIFRFLDESMTLADLERSLYDDHKIWEASGCTDSWLELVEIDFRKNEAARLTKKFLLAYTGQEYLNHIFLSLAKRLRSDDDKKLYAFANAYDLYCSGCSFLRDLGMGWGLPISTDLCENANAGRLSTEQIHQHTNHLNKYKKEINEQISLLEKWIQSGEVTVSYNDAGYPKYRYEDKRTEKEKASRIFKPKRVKAKLKTRFFDWLLRREPTYTISHTQIFPKE